MYTKSELGEALTFLMGKLLLRADFCARLYKGSCSSVKLEVHLIIDFEI